MSRWSLGIDFGTSYTVAAAAAQDGSTRVIDIEASGRDRIPSSVFITEDDDILVGTAAQHQAVFAPERYEPTPKRVLGLGDVFLGDDLVPVARLAAAVLQRVYKEACRQHGERPPSEVRITHPADWGGARLAVLEDAIDRAGLPATTLVPEPVAAAVRIAYQATEPGQHIAVYDFGGGTFDAAVLLRTDHGFETAGPPAGRDPLGGEDIDRRIVDHLATLLAGDAWSNLMNPPDVGWRRDSTTFRSEVTRAKETLTEVNACKLWVPGVEREVQITRAELDELIAPDIEATVDTLESALQDANVTAASLAGIYLVGGSSRIPLVATALWRRLDVRPAVQDNPKSVVALGAAAWVTGAPRRGASGSYPSLSGGVAFRSRVQLALGPERVHTRSQFMAEHGNNTLRARDDPGPGIDTAALADHAVRSRRQRTPGFVEGELREATVLGIGPGLERRFQMRAGFADVQMFEQYLVAEGRALVVAAPEEARAAAEAIFITGPLGRGAFAARWGMDHGGEWSISEEAALRRVSKPGGVTAVRYVPGQGAGLEAWRRDQIEILHDLAGAKIMPTGSGEVIGLPNGEIHTAVWSSNDGPMVSKLGLVAADGEAYAVTISLPHAEQYLFPPFAHTPRLG